MSSTFSFFHSLESDASFASDLSGSSDSSLAQSPSPLMQAALAPAAVSEQQQLLQQQLLKPFPFSRPASLDLSAPTVGSAAASRCGSLVWHNDPTMLDGFCLDVPTMESAAPAQASRKRKSGADESDVSESKKRKKGGKSLLSLSPSALSPASSATSTSSVAGGNSPLLALLAGSPSWDVALPPQEAGSEEQTSAPALTEEAAAPALSKEERRAAKRARAAAKLAKLEASIASLQQQLEHTQAAEAAAHAQAQIMAAHAAAEAQQTQSMQSSLAGGMSSPLPPLSPLDVSYTGASSSSDTASESRTPPVVLRALPSETPVLVQTPLSVATIEPAEMWSALGAVQSSEHLYQLRAMQAMQATMMACAPGLASRLLDAAPMLRGQHAELDAMVRAESEMQSQMNDALGELAAALLAKQHVHELHRRRAAEAALHVI